MARINRLINGLFSCQESEIRKEDNRTGGAAVSDRYPKPNYLQS